MAWILALVLVVPAYGWISSTPAAAATLPVTQDLKVHGDYILVGNGVLTCSTSDSKCVSLLRGSTDANGNTGGNQNAINDAVNMTYNDQDSNSSTYNSSSATLTIPSGAKVAYAEVVWSGNTGQVSGSSATACSSYGSATTPAGSSKTQPIQFTANGSTTSVAPGSYNTDSSVSSGQYYYYSASANVTSQLASLPSGSAQTITVGNVWAPSGYGCYGGWALQVVYDYGTYVMGNNNSILKEVYTYDTYQRLQQGGAAATLQVNNLNVQGSGSRFGAVGWEGDMVLDGDYVKYSTSSNTTLTALPGPGDGDTNDYFESYAEGSVPFASYSAASGSKFYNASVSAASSNLPNLKAGDTSLTMSLGTNQDSYLLTNAIVSVPLADATLYKTAANGEADQAVASGGTPTFRMTIYNSGSVAVLGLAVNDPLAPDCNRTTAQLNTLVQQTYPSGQVPAGGSVQYTCSGPAASASYTNAATLTGQTPTGIAVVSNSTSKVEVATWNVAKSPSTPDVPVGGTATWNISVNNTGGADIYNVAVTDSAVPACSRTVPLLQAGQSLSYTCTSTVTTTQTNTITATGTAKASSTATITVPMTGTASGTVYADAVTVQKTVDDPIVTVGAKSTFSFKVTNTGTSTLNTVALNDPDFPACNQANVGPLAAGASTTTTCTVTPFSSAAASTLTNHATVTATPPSGNAVTASSQVTVDDAAIKLTKTAATTDSNNNGVLDAGDKVAYSFSVQNTGSVPMSSLTIADPKVSGVTCTPTTVAVGATATCTAPSYTLTQADVDSGTLVNTATATAQASDGTKATSTASVTLTPVQQPAIKLAKTASPTTVNTVGQNVTYTLTTTNSGNTTLTGVSPADGLSGLSALSCTIGGTAVTLPVSLAPNGVLTCTATRATTQADLDAGKITNSASVSGTSPKGTVVNATAVAPVTATQNPAIQVTKTGSSATFGAAGQTITYTYALKNTGNVDLTGAQLNDPMSRLANKTCTPTQPASLAPGATLTCTATLTVTQADIDGGAILNTVTGTATTPTGSTLNQTASWTVTPATTPGLSLTKTPSRSSITAAGQAITYTFTTTNTGNTTVTNVQVSDPLPGLTMGSCTPASGSSLAPGARMSCTGSYTSTQADVDAGRIVNTATTTGTDSHGQALSSTATSTVTAAASPALALTKSASPSSVNAVGQSVTYSFAVRNTGNVSLSKVAVSDPLPGLSAVNCPATTLAPGASTTCTATRTTTQADLDAGSVSNTATATGTTPAGASVQSPSSTAKVSATQSPAFSVSKTPSPTSITAAGQRISYSITVANTGNVTLTNLRASDPRIASLTCSPAAAGASLAPGASTTCTGTYTATQADVNAGAINNTATATLTPPSGADISQSSSAVVQANRQPTLSLTKTGSTTSYGKAGDTTSYTITARNTGNVSLTSAQVSDPMFPASSPLTCTPAGATTLAPGDTISCTGQHTVTQAEVDAGTLTNTATVRATSPTGTSVTASSSFTATATPAPAVQLTKTANPASISTVGRPITYTLVLTNSGNVTLANAQVSDPMFASFTSCSPALGSSLAPGATLTCTGTHTSTQADVDAGAINNTATGQGTPPTGAPVSTQRSTVVTVTQNPQLTLTKSASPNRVSAVGQVVTYSFLVTNTGNVGASGVTVTDPLAGLSAVSCPATTLAPGASTTCTATRTTTQDDLNQASGTVVNTATVNATQPNGQAFPPASGSATVTMTQTPKLGLTKTASTTSVKAVGDVVNYTLTLVNQGNVQVTGATITDSMLTSMQCTPANPATLAPGASITCTGQHTTTQADLDARTIANTANGSATAPNGQAVPGVTATATVQATQTPAITVKKSSDVTTVKAVGDTVNYNYLVTNTGNVTVGSLSIADPHAGLTAITCPATTLAPGASTTCYARYTVTQDDLNAGSILDTATASVEKPGGNPNDASDNVTATGSAVVGVTQQPDFFFSKTANVSSFSTTGRSIAYSFTILNTGNVALHNARIADPLPGLSALSCTPAQGVTLAPGATLTCTATYTTTQADLDRGSIANTATGTAQAPDNSTVQHTASRTVTASGTPNYTLTKQASPSSITAAGQVITYSFGVQNTGNVTLHGLAVTDTDLPGLSDVSCPITTLAPGASTTCTATYTATQADVDRGTISNQASSTALDPSDAAITKNASATVQAPQSPKLALTKSATPATVAAVGDRVDYTFHVSNTGNVTVQSVAINDAHAGLSDITCASTTLAPGDSTDCTASYTATQADLDNGHITNSATASGTAPGGANVTSPASTATVNATQSPSRIFSKTANPTTVSAVGQTITYTLSTVNTGNVTLGSVYTSDPMHQNGQFSWTCNIYSTATGALLRGGTGPVSLAPGETKTCTALYTTTQADLDAGSITNTATSTGTDSSGTALPTLTSSAVVSVTQNPTMLFTKSADLTNYSSAGQRITYTFVLMNTGNVTIANARVADPHPGLSAMDCSPAMGSSLAPRTQMKCTSTYTVTQADVDNRSIDNTATGTATGADGSPMSQDATVSVPAALNPGISLSKVASPNPASTVGGRITYTFTVRNTGNDTLSGIQVSDPLDGLSPVSCPTTTLAPGATTSCTATMTLTQAQADAAQVPNTATVSATDPAGTQTSAKASTTLRVTQNPRLTLSKTASPTTINKVGDQVDYTFVVTNSGNVTIDQVAVSDPMLPTAPTCPQDTLAPGASMTCTASYTADQQDVDAGSITNTATAQGTTASGASVPQAQDSAIVTVPAQASMKFNKTADTTQVTRIGQTVTYTLTVANTGNVTLTNVFMSDAEIAQQRLVNCWVDHPDGSRTDAPGPVSLEPGSVKTCHGSRTFQQADFQVADPDPSTPGIDWTNTARVTADQPDGTPLAPQTASQTVYLQPSPDFQVTKSANTQTYSHAGQVVTYTVQARNTGNVQLANAHISDRMLPSATLTCSPAAGSTLQPNQTMTCSGQYAVTQADVDSGSILNQAYGVGTDDQGVEHTSTDPGQLVLQWQGSTGVQLDKTANPSAVNRAGDKVTYTLTVDNPGDVTLDDVVVSDPMNGLSDVSCPATQVAPGGSMACTATYTATQADIDNKGFTNTATVTATAAGRTVTTTASTTVLAAHQPSITLSKTAAIEGGKSAITAVGDVVDYTFQVANTGNVALHGIAIADQLAVDNLSCPSDSLDPQATMTCTATYTVTQADLDHPTLVNQASVSGDDQQGDDPVSAQAQATSPTAWTPGIQLTKTPSTTTVNSVGQVVTYTMSATNTGNTTLYNVLVTDPLAGLSKLDCGALTGPAILAPGQTKTCTATRATTQADLDAGSIPNTSSVTSTLPNGQAGPRAASSATVVATQTPHLSVGKVVDQPTYSQVGDYLGYTITTTNDGNVSVSNVQVTDLLPGVTNLSCTPALGSTLAPGQSMSCAGDYSVSQADLDAQSVVNTAHVTGNGPDGSTLSLDTAPAVSTAVVDSSIELSKTADTTTYDTVGQVVTYTLTATNTGNVSLSGVHIDDPMSGLSALSCDQDVPATLAPDARLVCTAKYTITQADIDNGQPLVGIGLTNKAHVAGTDPTGATIGADAQVTIQVFHNPKLVLTKQASPTTFSAVGQQITYTFQVQNQGNVLMHNIRLTDPLVTGIQCPTDTLEAGAAMTCTATMGIDQHMLDTGSVPNTASVHADDVDNSKVADAQAQATIQAVQNPSISLTKSGSPATVTQVGQPITFTVTATNTGNVTLGNVFIADPIPNHSTFACTITQTDGGTRNGTGPVSLAPQEVKTCHATYAATQADIDNGSIPNTANVTAVDGVGHSLKQYASWVTQVTQTPSLQVTKQVDQASYSQVGQKLNYTMQVTNTGNTTASNVQLTDAMDLDGLTCTPQLGTDLAAGAVMNCQGSHTVTQADLDAQTLSNTATASATDPNGQPEQATSNQVTSTATLTPSLTLHKSAAPTSVTTAGQVITYTFEVTNTGNATLDNVQIADPRLGSTVPTCDAGDAPYTLAPGKVLTCTAPYTVTQADIDSAEPKEGIGISNTATASGTAPDGTVVDGDGTANVAVTHMPALTLVKTASPTTYQAVGDQITYSFVVTNTGTVTMKNFVLTDPLPGLSALSCDADLATVHLAPGQHFTCTGTRAIRQAGIDNGRVDNTATVTADDIDQSKNATATGSATVTAVQRPAMTLTKSANVTTVNAVGDVVVYTVTMANTGNTTLSNVFIADPLPGHTTFACTITAVDGSTRQGTGPVTVYPGETKTCTTQRATTQADLDAGAIDNTANVTAQTPQGVSVPTVYSNPVVVAATQQPAIQLTKQVTPARPAAAGDTLTYAFTLSNPGTVTLSNVQLVDPMPGLSDFSCDTPLGSSLAPGDEIHCTATKQVTADEMNQPTLDNTATATASAPGAPNGSVSSSASAQAVPVHHPSLSLTKTHDVTAVTAAGQKVQFDFTVTNTGNIGVSQIAVDDPLAGVSTPVCAATSLAVGASTTCTASYTATQADVDRGRIDNTASVSGVDTLGSDPVTPGHAQDQVPVTQTSTLAITKTPVTPAPVNLGDDAEFRIVTTNTGNTTVANVRVDDPASELTSMTCDPVQGSSLAPGVTMTCLAHLAVDQADLDAGVVTNSATATGQDPSGADVAPVGDNAQIRTVVGTASADFTKTSSPSTVTKAGDTVTYTFTVKNTGTLSLGDPRVSDPMPGLMNLTCDHDSGTALAPGATMTCTATYTVLQSDADAGRIDNTASFDALVPPSDKPFHTTARTTTTVTQSPALSLTKNADRSQVQDVGDRITYTFDVRNTGNVGIDLVTINDALPISDPTCVDAAGTAVDLPTRLAPGAQLVCQANHEVTQSELDAGSILNSATASGRTDLGTPVASPTASTVVQANQNPAIQMTKTADTTLVQKVGDRVTYTITARNTGNVTVSNAQVADPANYDSFTCDPEQGSALAPGATMTCTGVYTVVHTDLEHGSISNVATFTGTDPNGSAVTDTAGTTVPALYNPKLAFAKTVDAPANWKVGDTVTYTYTVSNVGNMDAYQFVGHDTMPDLALRGCTVNGAAVNPATDVLHPGQEAICTGTKPVTQADADAGRITNTATVQANEATGQPFQPETATAVTTTDLTGSLAVTKSSDIASYDHVGQQVTWSVGVTNTGPVTLSGFRVDDQLSGISAFTCDQNSLAPGASTTCTATSSVTQADLDRGHVDNTASVTASDPHGTRVGPQSASHSIQAQTTASLSLTKQAQTSSVSKAGQLVQYTLTSTNTGTVTLHDVGITDQLAGTTITGCDRTVPATLAPGDVLHCQVDYHVTQDDMNKGRVLNTAVANGTDPQGAAVPEASAQATVAAQRQPSIQLTKTPDVSSVDTLGQTITYTFVATNTGNTTIEHPVITDPLPGLSDQTCTPAADTALDPGEAMTCTATYQVTQADLDNGTIPNTAIVRGENVGGDPNDPADDVTAEASATVKAVMEPALTLKKSADVPSVAHLDDSIGYSFLVTNSGNVDLHDVTVSDPLTAQGMGPISCPATTLAPGASMTCHATFHPAQQDLDRGYVPNTATAKGLDPMNEPAKEGVGSARVEVEQSPAYALTKTADHTDVTHAGERVLYTFVGTNTGNVTLHGVTVTDPLPGLEAMDCYPRQPADLPPAASIICRAWYTVTQADLDAGSVLNTATINGTDPQGNALDPVQAQETIRTVVHSELQVVKSTPSLSYSHAGEVLTYTITAKNLGNQRIHDVVVKDLAPGASTLSCTDEAGNVFPMTDPSTLALDPDTGVQCTVTYPVTQADVDAGRFTNTAEMDALDPTGTPVEPAQGSVTVVATQAPAVQVAKTVSPAQVDAAGQQVTWSIATTNTGNVTLHGLTIADPMVGDGQLSCPSLPAGTTPADATLAPGETLTCTYGYTATQADVDAGSVHNTVGVTAQTPANTTVADSGEATLAVQQSPSVSFTKTADTAGPLHQGDTVHYTLTVANTGNVTATVGHLDEPMAGPAGSDQAMTCSPALPASLAPGATMTCTLAHTVTADEAYSGSLTNQAVATVSDPDGHAISVPPAQSVVPTEANAQATLAKEAVLNDTNGNGTAQPGETVDYTITAHNTGDTTLRNVQVSDPMFATLACTPSVPSTLAPDASIVCTGRHVVTAAEAARGSLVNTATLTSSDLAAPVEVQVSTDTASNPTPVPHPSQSPTPHPTVTPNPPAPSSPAPTPGPRPVKRPPLASTGSPVSLWMLALGIGCTIAGFLLVVRRRRD